MFDKSLLGARVLEMLDLAKSHRAYLAREAGRMQIRHNQLLAAAIVGLAEQVLEASTGNGWGVQTGSDEGLEVPTTTVTFRYHKRGTAKAKGRPPRSTATE
jgi:hypothetical protein